MFCLLIDSIREDEANTENLRPIQFSLGLALRSGAGAFDSKKQRMRLFGFV